MCIERSFILVALLVSSLWFVSFIFLLDEMIARDGAKVGKMEFVTKICLQINLERVYLHFDVFSFFLVNCGFSHHQKEIFSEFVVLMMRFLLNFCGKERVRVLLAVLMRNQVDTC